MNNLLLDSSAGVATVTLNRPDVRNAFNDETIAELTAAFLDLSERTDVRCIVLAATGSAFCAGADLNWMKRMADYSREQNVDDAAALARMLEVIYRCPKPTIARVQGDTYAGGMGLVAACDVAVAAVSAKFCLSEVKLGLIPATISPYVIRAIGARAAHRWFLTAERFSAEQAERIGLVHETVADDALESKVQEVAEALVVAGPQAVKACKQLVQDVTGQEITHALIHRTINSIADIRASAEGREGIDSFLNKRRPSWLGVQV